MALRHKAKTGVLLYSVSIYAVFASGVAGPFGAMAQESQSGALFLRGTAEGQQEQDPVFDEGDPLVIPGGSAAGVVGTGRDTADPAGQLQGLTRPEQPIAVVTDPLETGTPSARSNLRAPREQDGTGASVDNDAFAALGFRMGSWRAFSNVEQTIGYSTNLDQTANGEGGAFSQTDASLSLQSDWSRHSARIDANGNFRHALTSDTQDIPSANVSGVLNLDLVDEIGAEFGANYGIATEAVTSNTITAATDTRPGVQTYGAFAGINRTGHKLFYSLRGSIGRTAYDDIELVGGGTSSQEDRNNTLYSVIGRIGYEVSPALRPFIELEAGMRQHELTLDRNGDARDSRIFAGRSGLEIDLGEKLRGEVSVGYQVENFDGSNLEDLAGLTIDGNLVWSPVRDTTVTLAAQTDFSGSTTSGQNGSLVYGTSLTVERQVNDRLSLSANAAVGLNRQDDGSRTDVTYSAGVGFNYWINRFMAFTGSAQYSTQQSTAGSTSEYDDTTIRAGIRLQR